MNSVLLPIHIAAGGLALLLGAVALVVKKGGTVHRRSAGWAGVVPEGQLPPLPKPAGRAG